MNLSDYIRPIPDFPKPGILFRDITPLLANAAAFQQTIDQLAAMVRERSIDLVAAAEARGFLFAAPLALKLGLGLVLIRKPGKLPSKCLSHTYQLEYGTDTLQIHDDCVPPGARVLMVDDVLATGGTIDACCRLVEKAGGKIDACQFVIELAGLGGRKRIDRYETLSLICYE
jgi:adenine phosphoribosyltransferase